MKDSNECTRHVSEITFIMHADMQKTKKPNYLRVFRKYIKYI